jgi:hypothetical protein
VAGQVVLEAKGLPIEVALGGFAEAQSGHSGRQCATDESRLEAGIARGGLNVRWRRAADVGATLNRSPCR